MQDWNEMLSDNAFWGLFHRIAPTVSVSAVPGGYTVSGNGGPRIRLDLGAEGGRPFWRVDAETRTGQFYYSGYEDVRGIKSVLTEIIEVYVNN